MPVGVVVFDAAGATSFIQPTNILWAASLMNAMSYVMHSVRPEP